MKLFQIYLKVLIKIMLFYFVGSSAIDNGKVAKESNLPWSCVITTV